jgi:hypothetical protein
MFSANAALPATVIVAGLALAGYALLTTAVNGRTGSGYGVAPLVPPASGLPWLRYGTRRDGPPRTVACLPEDAGESALLNETGCRGGLRHTRREAR